MWQIKKSAQPVTVALENAAEGAVAVTNRYLFTDLEDLQTTWTLEADGAVIDQGSLTLSLAPLEKNTVKIPFRKPEVMAGVDYRLTVSFRQKEDKPWAQAGYEIAWDQFEMPWHIQATASEKDEVTALTVEETTGHLVVKGNYFTYTFDKGTGGMTSMQCDGKELIRRGPALNVWRAPLANETDPWGSWSSGVIHWGEGYGHMAATDWYTTGLNNLHQQLESMQYAATEQQVVIRVADIMTMARPSHGFQNKYTYTIGASGEMTLRHTVIPSGDMPAWIPRVGTAWILDKSLDQVQWYGRGPQENYPDRKSGYKIGRYASTVAGMEEPYLIPQDYGLRTDNRWVTLLDKDGTGLQFSGDQLFNYSAWPYSLDNLTKALYTYQLQPFEGITFNFDYATSGVGCTARSVFNQYRVLPQRYDFTMQVRPVRDE
jgi:beta-galactosidase